jgi:hypothetical protein
MVTAEELIILDDEAAELGLEPMVYRLDRDLVRAATKLTPREMQYLVKTYYRIQKVRIQLGNAVTAAKKRGEPALHAEWLAGQLKRLEDELRKVMHVWAQEYPAGEWALAQVGIGPTLAAALLAYIDPEKAKTAGDVWRFAGLDPTLQWSEGKKRPFCQELKAICYRIGDSFVKTSRHPKSFYGRIYRERKAYEQERNERGEYAEQAAKILASKRVKSRELKAWLEQGKLSPGHIEMRARRYAVKLFLAHFQQVLYETTHGTPAPAPYPIAHLGHADVIAPPGYTPLRV